MNVEEGVEMPVIVFSSSEEGDFKERWEVVYKGRTRVCYGCYRPEHIRGQCPNNKVTFEALKEGVVQGSWAQVVKGLGRPIKQGDQRLEPQNGSSENFADRRSSERL